MGCVRPAAGCVELDLADPSSPWLATISVGVPTGESYSFDVGVIAVLMLTC